MALAFHALMEPERVGETRAGPATAAAPNRERAGRPDRQEMPKNARAVIVKVCQEPTEPVKAMARLQPMARAGLPSTEAVAARMHLPVATVASPAAHSGRLILAWGLKSREERLSLLHTGCRNAGSQRVARRIEGRRVRAFVAFSLAFH